MIYYVTDGNFIKIGYAKSSPQIRVDTLQTGNVNHLEILAVEAGELDDEHRLHETFAEHRERGEWFEPSDGLIKRINGIRAAAGDPPIKDDAKSGVTVDGGTGAGFVQPKAKTKKLSGAGYRKQARERNELAKKQREEKKQLKAQRVQLSALESETVAAQWMALAASSPKTINAGEHQELPVIGAPPPKYVAAVEGILLGLEAGMFHAAASLADSMLRDDRIAATLSVRVNGLVGSRLDLEPSLDTVKARRVKEDAEEQLTYMMPLTQIGELLRWGLLLGVGIAQVTYERDGRSWCPKFTVWHPKFLRFDWATRRYKLITADDGEITIEPGDPQWIVYEPYGPKGWLRCLMRSLAMPWLLRAWNRSWWGRYAEIHGTPIRLGIIPQQADVADEKRFLSQLSTLAHEAVIRLPQAGDANKFDVKLLEAQSNTFQGFQALMQHCDDSIAISILGQRQSTTGQGGLGSQENAGDSVRIDLKRSDALVGDTLREQFLKPWAQFNYGSDDLAPYIRWQVDPPEDLAKKAQELLTLYQAIQIAPADVDKRAVLESFNQPLLDEADVPPDIPGSPDPLPQPSDDEGDEPDEDDDDEAEGTDEPKADAQQLSARITKLSEAAKQGDAYSLALAASAKKLAAKALGPDLEAVKRDIEESTSPSDLRERLKKTFAGMDPAKLADITHKALVMAKLAGRAVVHQEVKKK